MSFLIMIMFLISIYTHIPVVYKDGIETTGYYNILFILTKSHTKNTFSLIKKTLFNFLLTL